MRVEHCPYCGAKAVPTRWEHYVITHKRTCYFAVDVKGVVRSLFFKGDKYLKAWNRRAGK